jgi:hypothetical protein
MISMTGRMPQHAAPTVELVMTVSAKGVSFTRPGKSFDQPVVVTIPPPTPSMFPLQIMTDESLDHYSACVSLSASHILLIGISSSLFVSFRY